jgi:hypothetical protein
MANFSGGTLGLAACARKVKEWQEAPGKTSKHQSVPTSDKKTNPADP